MRVAIAAVVMLLAGCTAAAGINQGLPVEQACLITADNALPVNLEIARSPEERRQGLMGRERLAEDAGMLFVYASEQRASRGFWMYRTLIPLDIAYLDREGTIRTIRQMAPCPEQRGLDCPAYEAGVPFLSALEMNQGYFRRHDIDVGDRLSRNPSDCR